MGIRSRVRVDQGLQAILPYAGKSHNASVVGSGDMATTFNNWLIVFGVVSVLYFFFLFREQGL